MTLKGHIQTNEISKWVSIGEALTQVGGKSLVLFSSSEEMERFRDWGKNQKWDFNLVYEGDREISETVKTFQYEESTVLCSYHLWEGLDVPGESLKQVVISSLPFPPKDPVFQAKRKNSKNPLEEVDTPYMLLRLRQGIGRLIRSREDQGTVHIWLTQEQKDTFFKEIEKILPVEVVWE
jgi:ATP-dependent DNA helicase DinG